MPHGDSQQGAAMAVDFSSGGMAAQPMFLREMLYVDTSRVRSYLAQMEQGLPERVQQAEGGCVNGRQASM